MMAEDEDEEEAIEKDIEEAHEGNGNEGQATTEGGGDKDGEEGGVETPKGAGSDEEVD